MPKIVKIAAIDTLDDWKKQLESENKPHNTVRNRLGYIRRFIATNSTPRHRLEVHEITALHVAAAFNTYGPGHTGSCNGLTVALNRWLHWCIRMHYITADDVECAIGDRRTRQWERSPKLYIPASEFPRLLEIAGARHPHRKGTLTLLMGTLARQGEISALRLADLDLSTRMLHETRFKTRNSTRDYISDDWYGGLIEHLEWYAAETGYGSDYERMRAEHPEWHLLPGLRAWGGVTAGARIQIYPDRDYKAIRNVVKDVLDDAGIVSPSGHGDYVRNKGEGGHTFRRSCARAMFEYLEPIHGLNFAKDLVMAKLNHKTWEVTAQYIGYDVNRKQLHTYLQSGGSLYGVPLSGGGTPPAAPAEGAEVIQFPAARMAAAAAL